MNLVLFRVTSRLLELVSGVLDLVFKGFSVFITITIIVVIHFYFKF